MHTFKHAFYLLALAGTTALLSACTKQPLTPDPAPQPEPALTPTETFDATATASSSLIKSMRVESSVDGPNYEGPRFEYQYSYDANNRLTKLDFRSISYKYLIGRDSSYGTLVHRVAMLEYNPAGELSRLRMDSYTSQGVLESQLTFPVQNQQGNLVVYGLEQWYPNPVGNQPILKITSTKQLVHLPRSWNTQPNTQFALQTLDYDPNGNLNGVLLTHLGTSFPQTLQQTALLTQISHSSTVLNPFGADPAYGAAHFLVRGGLDFTLTTWLDVSKYMVRSSTVKQVTREVNGPGYSGNASSQTLYSYHYNNKQLPTYVEYRDATNSSISQCRVSFSY